MKKRLLTLAAILSMLFLSIALGVYVNAVIRYSVSAKKPIQQVQSIDVVARLVNDERKLAGLSELIRDKRLDAVALTKCNDMVTKDYWSHNSPDGKTPFDFLKESNVYYLIAGENLAADTYDEKSIVRQWMGSPSHRDNILNSRYTNVGYAQCRYSQVSSNMLNKPLVVQIFTLPQ